MDRQTDRDIQKDRQTDSKTDRHLDRQLKIDRQTEADRQVGRKAGNCILEDKSTQTQCFAFFIPVCTTSNAIMYSGQFIQFYPCIILKPLYNR